VTPQLISIYVLAAMFVVATILPVNMGVLAFVGAFLVGTLVAGLPASAIIADFPGELFLTLVGITYLFAIAQNNGTIDWLVRLSVGVVRGRIAAIPWIMFAISAVLTSVGAVSPGAVAIIAPIALGFAAKYNISPLLMGLMVVHGAQGGGFSPTSIYGGITNGVVAKAGLPLNELATFMGSLVVNLAVAVVLFFVLGGRRLIHQRDVGVLAGASAEVPMPRAEIVRPQSGPGAYGDVEAEALSEEINLKADQAAKSIASAPSAKEAPENRLYQIATLVGILTLALLALAFKLNIGFVALTIGLVLSLMAPNLQKRAIGQVTWPEIMLITGVGTYAALMEQIGTTTFVANSVAGLASPLTAALALCFIGAVVSAFASSVAVLGSLIPLAVPFLQSGTGVNPIGFVAAMAVSSTIVDVSPFSTNGALVLANAKGIDKDVFFRQLLGYGALVTVTAPAVVWVLFVVFT
jgi:di/tricarboxylate transporter